jgi:hypothetical protein
MKYILSSLLIIIVLIQGLTAQEKNLPQLDIKTKKVVIDSLCKAITKYYVFTDKAVSMIDLLMRKNQIKGYNSITNPNDFANILEQDLRSVYDDKHLTVRYDPELEKRIINYVLTKTIESTDFVKELNQNFFFKKVEVLPSNIGLIEFTNFSDTSHSARETVRAAMKFVSHTDAVIIDLRHNFGGNGIMASEIGSYFFDYKTFTGRSFNQVENLWKDIWIENKPEITNGLVMNMPIYILTSNRTYSAAEGLAYNLQQMKQAVVIGDTTRGGAHLTRSFSLGNGFVGFIPFTRLENSKTKTDWERTGVIPDIAVDESNSLITAERTILIKKLSTISDETEKRKINWLINFYNAKSLSVSYTNSDLIKFTGLFEEFEFSVLNNELFCKNTHQTNKRDRLVPITSTLFQIDNESQVEFIANDKGLYMTIKLYWNDGWVDTIQKTK